MQYQLHKAVADQVDVGEQLAVSKKEKQIAEQLDALGGSGEQEQKGKSLINMMEDQSNLNKLIDGAVSDEFSAAQKTPPQSLAEGSAAVVPQVKVDLSNPNQGLFQSIAEKYKSQLEQEKAADPNDQNSVAYAKR